MSKVFGITKFPNEEAGQVVYLVWSAPAPADDTEPEYVKPLHIRFTLAAAERMLYSEESKYAEELTKIVPEIDVVRAGQALRQQASAEQGEERTDSAWEDHVRSIPGYME